MSSYEIVAFYVALNTILFVWLTLRVIVVRRRDKVSLGHNDNNNLKKRIRSHANFAETAPLALIGLIVLAALNASTLALHIFGGSLTIGRILHSHGMLQRGAVGPARPIGMLLTLFVLLGQALYMAYLIFAR